MCGICGILTRSPAAARTATERMCRRLSHRGPDAEGLEVVATAGERFLGLGHRRLSILDLSEAGNQPMTDPDSGNRIVFNGEIYNYPALRRSLQAEGVAFQSHTDTEVILKGYARRGIGILKELQGMFAFGLYDAARGRLLLARDPLGIKPVYYAWSPGGDFVFASEIRAIAHAGVIAAEVDRVALASCLAYGAVQEPLAMLKGVRLLNAGEWMELDARHPLGRVTDYGRFWSFPVPGSFAGTREEAVRALRERVDHAVGGHLLSDVPVGLFLSAGVDSSAIASVCSRLGRSLETWTYSTAEGGKDDETPVAAEVARLFNLPHRTVTISASGLQSAFGQFVGGLDQPTVDGFNTWLMARACRQHGHKVALSGLGGDELFGGYAGMRRMPWLFRVNQALRVLTPPGRRALVRLIGLRLSPCQREKLAELLRPDWTLNELALSRRRLFSRLSLKRLGFGDVDWSLNAIDLPLESDLYSGTLPAFPKAAIGVLDARFYMRNMLLRDADVCGMAHGVEIRVPWLDRGVAELAFSLPGKWRQPRGGINKPLLVEAAGVPAFVYNRRKTGFSLPYTRWLKTEWREQRDASLASLAGRGFLDGGVIRSVCRDFEAYPNGPEWSRVWMLMVLEGWWASFFSPGGNGP